MSSNRKMGTARRLTRALAVTALVVAPLAACDTNSILQVNDPDVVQTSVFSNPTNLAAVRNGAIREFARAYGGTQNTDGGQILYSGLLGDEFYASGTFATRRDIDERHILQTNASNEQAYFWLQRARNHAEQAADIFAADDSAGTADDAYMYNLAGYTYDMFGENYCSGVPFSRLPATGPTDYGAPQTTPEIFQRAIMRFDTAMAMAQLANSTDQMNLARVGKARALLDLDSVSEAAAVASAVPTDFTFDVRYDASVQDAWNAVWEFNNSEKRWSVAGGEGGNGLPYLTDNDPRTPTAASGTGFNGDVPHYDELKYTGAGSAMPLATGIEARLIEAEAALRSGDRTTFFQIHNALRATVGLPALSDTGQTTDQLVTLHFRERAYWLWLTSHRLGDMRRLVRQYGRSIDSVFPTGLSPNGAPFGTDVNLPIPFSEQNNPKFKAAGGKCLDRNP
ncbi:MAG TPA: RagB/SusD family nutrient uptake outer membrane protein [Longimicrobiales bacterium]|nr:RagB/SusD family nutrient uptake outer membrane protein [Longimicrobiales bacterium]